MINIKYLTGVKEFKPPQYYTRSLGDVPGEMWFAMCSGGLSNVQEDDSLPSGVLESRCDDGTQISRLSWTVP